MFGCKETGCDKQFKTESGMREHLLLKHDKLFSRRFGVSTVGGEVLDNRKLSSRRRQMNSKARRCAKKAAEKMLQAASFSEHSSNYLSGPSASIGNFTQKNPDMVGFNSANIPFATSSTTLYDDVLFPNGAYSPISSASIVDDDQLDLGVVDFDWFGVEDELWSFSSTQRTAQANFDGGTMSSDTPMSYISGASTSVVVPTVMMEAARDGLGVVDRDNTFCVPTTTSSQLNSASVGCQADNKLPSVEVSTQAGWAATSGVSDLFPGGIPITEILSALRRQPLLTPAEVAYRLCESCPEPVQFGPDRRRVYASVLLAAAAQKDLLSHILGLYKEIQKIKLSRDSANNYMRTNLEELYSRPTSSAEREACSKTLDKNPLALIPL